tara:strand:- start:808 stop:1176 length:369 start_codon:yes stop_codon:yes gene_type:complete
MTTLDTTLLAKVAEIADTYGKSVVFQSVGSSSYNPATGKTTESSITNYTVKVTPPAPYSRTLVDGDLIQTMDVGLLLPAKDLSFTPALGMQVTIDGEVLDIVSMSPLYSGTSVCAYDIQLRQ